MENIYLTAGSKEKYMHDFSNNVLLFNRDESWKLDPGLAEILTSVNRNSCIQTLYSKKDHFTSVEYLHESYLEFCYSKDVELEIFRKVIPSLNLDFIREAKSIFFYTFSFPRENPNISMGLSGMGCLDDPEYSRINTIRLTLESPIKLMHDKFWSTIGDYLGKLTDSKNATKTLRH